MWIIKHKDNAGKAVILTRPVRAIDPQEETRLVFHRYGDVYFLSEFWTVGSKPDANFRSPTVKKRWTRPC